MSDLFSMRVVKEEDHWLVLRQFILGEDDLGDPWVINVDKPGRCWRIGQVRPSDPDEDRDRPADELHVCNIDLLIEMLTQARDEVRRVWGDD